MSIKYFKGDAAPAFPAKKGDWLDLTPKNLGDSVASEGAGKDTW